MAKHKYIKSPDEMWELFLQYREATKSNPIKVHDFVGKDAVDVYRLRERPLTMEGFENFVANIDGMPMELSHYFSNKDKRYSEYVAICSRITKSIRQDQIEGGMANIYNPSITQRLNGLSDKTQVEIVEQPLFPDIE